MRLAPFFAGLCIIACLADPTVAASKKRHSKPTSSESIKLESLMKLFPQNAPSSSVTEDTSEDSSDEADSKRSSSNKNRIETITVKGAVKTSTALIFNEISLKEGDTFSVSKLNNIIKNILSLGVYSEARYKRNGKTLVIEVKENPVIGKVVFAGAKAISAEELQNAIQLHPDSVLSTKALKSDIFAIKDLYQSKGFVEARVIAVISPEQDGDPLIFRITEGVIESISVTGNKTTKTYVILREMDTKPGSVLQDKKLREDLRRVYNLGYFTDFRTNFLQGTTLNAFQLELDVTERSSNGSFSFGGGFSPTAGASFFSNLYWDNLAGTGQLIMLNSQVGRAGTLQFKYFNPWMWDKRRSFTLKTWLQDGSVESFSTTSGSLYRNERNKGIQVGFGIPASYELKTQHDFKYESVVLTDKNRSYSIQSYIFGISYDTRDVKFNPTNGDFHSLTLERALPLYSHSIDFTKYDLELRRFIKTFDQQTIALRLLLGQIQSPQLGDTDLFAREIYRAGGSTTVRGYSDYDPFAIGSRLVVANVEYRFLFNDVFQLIFFVDAGYAPQYKSSPDDPYTEAVPVYNLSRYKMGKGIGTRIQVPMLGPIRLDYGIGERDQFVHFNVGYSF